MVSPFKAFMVVGAAAVATASGAHAQADATSPRLRVITPRVAVKLAPEAPFRPIAASRDGLTLRGEFATSEHPIFLSANDALRANAFRIGFTNAVSNLPGVSRLTVRINDQQVGEVSLNASGEMGQAVLAVPLGVLVPGFNSVRFTANQRHRVDCSVDATYELWTEVSPSQTGFVNIAPVPQIKRVADLPLLAGLAAGRTPIRIRMADGGDAAALDQAMRAANALILAGSISHPQIEVSPEPGHGPGVDLVIGNRVSTTPGIRLEPELGLFVAQDGANERTVLTINSMPGVDIDSTIQRLETIAAQRLRPGSKAGQRAVANLLGRRVGNNSSFTFADLGMEPRTFDGRFLQMSTRLMLPPDFFPAPYDVARISLNSAFTGEANIGQRLSIRVNDQIAAIVPIIKPGQGGLDDRSIELPLQAFKPGANVISVEANLASGTGSCDATVSPASGSRFLISSGSKISFGRLARVESYPNLSATLGYGFPYADGRKPMVVGVSNQDPAFLDGAMTMIGRMVASAQMPIATSFRFRPLDSSNEPGIYFGSPSEVPREPDNLETPVASAAPTVLVTSATARTRLAAAASDGATQTDATSLAHTTPEIDAVDNSTIAITRKLRAAFDVEGTLASARRLAQGDFSGATTWLQEFGLSDKKEASRSAALEVSTDSLVIRQSVIRTPGATFWRGFFDAGAKPTMQTVVLGADPAKFAELIEKATSDQFWPRFAGDAARVNLEDWGPTNRFSQAAVYTASSDTSPANMRLVAAGWLSLNQGYYLTILAGLVALLAATTALALRSRRL